MKKLEKEFSILKKEEQEEQVEMRVRIFKFIWQCLDLSINCLHFNLKKKKKRLRAENKLLKQRIDNLEKVSNILTIFILTGFDLKF